MFEIAILPLEDTLEPLPDRAEDSLDGALDTLLDRPLMNRAQTGRNIVALFEVLRVGRTSLDRTQVGHVAEVLASQIARRFEGAGRQSLGGAAHEIGPDWQRDSCSGSALADACRLVVAHPDTRDHR